MFVLIFISSLFLFASSLRYKYKELQRLGEINADYYTRVYFNISHYNVGDHLYFEMIMNLSHASSLKKYRFSIGQVSTSFYDDEYSWDHLYPVFNSNRECDKSYKCTFKWEEIISQVGNNYIFIKPTAPYSGYYFVDYQQIKIKNVKPNNINLFLIIVIALCCIIFLSIIIIVIALYIRKKNSHSKHVELEVSEYPDYSGLGPAPVNHQLSPGLTIY